MNESQWLELWVLAFHPLYFGQKDYVDLKLFSVKDYPALKLLDSLTELEFLLLCKLIVDKKTFKDFSEPISFTVITEIFEPYCTSIVTLDEALSNLIERGWISINVDHHGDRFYEVILHELRKESLYLPDDMTAIKAIGEIGTN